MEASLARKAMIAAFVLTGLLHCSAFAKDLTPPAGDAGSNNWSGPYFGLIVGGAEGRSSATSIVDCNVQGFLCDPIQYSNNGALIGATASGAKSQAAFTAGATAGYNWRLHGFVYGVEADVSPLRLDLADHGSASSLNLGLTNNPGNVEVVFRSGAAAEINWLATLRARAGYLVSPDILVYATGGLALTNLSVSNSYSDNWIYNGGGVGGSKAASSARGYAVGGGVEWAVAQGWTLKAEYLRVGFGSLTTSGPIYPVQVANVANPFTSTADLTANLFRVGFNHSF